MSVEDVLRILYPGVQGLLNQKQASNLVLSLMLLALGKIDAPTLKFLARFFTTTDYDELVLERTITHTCGYPLCDNQTKGPKLLTAFAWSGHYCSRHCYLASQFYRKQLSDEVLVTRRDVAFAPYGQLAYETNILILDEVEHFARTNHISTLQAIREMMSGDLDQAFEQLQIDTPGVEEDIKEAVFKEAPKMEIKEKQRDGAQGQAMHDQDQGLSSQE